jgi:hypothetical protein
LRFARSNLFKPSGPTRGRAIPEISDRIVSPAHRSVARSLGRVAFLHDARFVPQINPLVRKRLKRRLICAARDVDALV